MREGIDFDKEINSIEQCLEKGEKLDEKKMIMLFFFGFLQEEGKVESGYWPKQST